MSALGFSRVLLLSLALAGEAGAVGFGDLRGQPVLGNYPEFEIDIYGGGKEITDPACFRLRQPADSDFPWLKKAKFSVRPGQPPVLLVRGEAVLREPILQLAVHLACGHDVVREYTVLASPAREAPLVNLPVPAALAGPEAPATKPRPARLAASPVPSGERLQRAVPAVQQEKRRLPKVMPDRLVLSGDGEVGEPSLRLATELFSWERRTEVGEAQREILRLEFRMLLALQEQATSQLAAAEKLRNMEETLGELQKRSAEFAQQLEKGVAAPSGETAAPPVADKVPSPAPAPTSAKQPLPADSETTLSEWSLYGLVLGALLGMGGWLGWRNYRERRQRLEQVEPPYLVPDLAVDAQRSDEWDGQGEIDLPMELAERPMQVDVHLDGDEELPVASPVQAVPPARQPEPDSELSISSATVDEHFEANPVMELADIMLSFGRVKGAAQALQEFIDNNPQDAIQPWIRLMDIYRMAGMREEFESVAHNLNQYFNVEVQRWDVAQPSAERPAIDLVLGEEPGGAVMQPGDARPLSLDGMPRIMQQIVDLWSDGEVLAYLHQLLRDNRGGKRAGFTLPVVEEILFLIELKETMKKIDREAEAS